MAVATHALVAEACLIGNLGMPQQAIIMIFGKTSHHDDFWKNKSS